MVLEFETAIYDAGGMYYWYNEALVYWTVAGLITITGLLIPFVKIK